MSVSPLLGRLYAYRNRGDQWVSVARQWIMPVMTGAGVSKYLGLDAQWAVLAWVGIALVCEVISITIGRWAQVSGATKADHQLLLDVDPFRRQSIDRLVEIRDELRSLNSWAQRGSPSA